MTEFPQSIKDAATINNMSPNEAAIRIYLVNMLLNAVEPRLDGPTPGQSDVSYRMQQKVGIAFGDFIRAESEDQKARPIEEQREHLSLLMDACSGLCAAIELFATGGFAPSAEHRKDLRARFETSTAERVDRGFEMIDMIEQRLLGPTSKDTVQ